MAEAAFDTLDAARRLKAAGIEVEHAEAIVEVMGQSVNRLVTREHFDLTAEHFDLAVERLDATVERIDAKIAKLSARVDAVHAELRDRIDTGIESLRTELGARIDVGHAELRGRIDAVETNMSRALLLSVGVLLAAITLATTILGMMLTRGGGM